MCTDTLLVIITWKFFGLLQFAFTYISSHLYNCIMSFVFFFLWCFMVTFYLYHNWAWLVSSKQLLRREAFPCTTLCLHPFKYRKSCQKTTENILSYTSFSLLRGAILSSNMLNHDAKRSSNNYAFSYNCKALSILVILATLNAFQFSHCNVILYMVSHNAKKTTYSHIYFSLSYITYDRIECMNFDIDCNSAIHWIFFVTSAK